MLWCIPFSFVLSTCQAATASTTSTGSGSALRAAVTTTQVHYRQAAATSQTVGTIKELRWVNADSNRRNFVVDTSYIVPINTLPEFAAEALDGYEVNPNIQLAMEAIIATGSGRPVGSVKFTYDNVTLIDNTPPYALCGNTGIDFMPCRGLNQNTDKVYNPNVGPLHIITAQVFASPNAKGAASPILTTYIGYTFRAEPFGNFVLYNADSDTELDYLNDDGTIPVVNVTKTPRVAILLDAWGARFRWWPESARVVYDQGAKIVVLNERPLVFPGRTGTNFWPLAPKRGPHTISATLYRKKNRQSQNTTWGPVSFTVVV
jgi:hypothetical protein